MISESYKHVIRIISKFIQIGQKKTQRLVVLLYQMQSIPGSSSIFTAVAKAVDLGLDFIKTCATHLLYFLTRL